MYFRNYRLWKTWFKPLSRKRCFRTSFGSQRVNGCQTLVKFALEHLYYIFWSLWGKMICKLPPLLKSEILEVFCLLTHWLSMTSILFGIVRICSYLFKCNYLKNKKLFSQVFVPFIDFWSDFKHFLKKDYRDC